MRNKKTKVKKPQSLNSSTIKSGRERPERGQKPEPLVFSPPKGPFEASGPNSIEDLSTPEMKLFLGIARMVYTNESRRGVVFVAVSPEGAVVEFVGLAELIEKNFSTELVETAASALEGEFVFIMGNHLMKKDTKQFLQEAEEVHRILMKRIEDIDKNL